ncbi:MAG TPA: DUF433 domain-containing protein [Chloroflexota bacterium]|nr:DUF433 domain-containing protein [Chloroflexota bacterium]
MSRLTRADLLQRISRNPEIFGGKPTIRGRRLAVEQVLSMLAAGDSPERLLEAYPWLEREDILACFAYAYQAVVSEYQEAALAETSR